jgi:hypothetical protein
MALTSAERKGGPVDSSILEARYTFSISGVNRRVKSKISNRKLKATVNVYIFAYSFYVLFAYCAFIASDQKSGTLLLKSGLFKMGV